MFMFLLECWTSKHLKHHKKLPRRVKNALNNTSKQKKPPTHPNKQTQTRLAYAKWSAVYLQSILIF